ncbi:MAG: hypothetical protein KatS3mg114_0564 [Planctomycetaceae bacterium]|nr:MAG: hypothetical protein KatS3mg114_0564 [Planctomycetaceae bacterium]
MELAINLLDDEIPLNRLCLGVPRETYPQERRVSLVPSVVKQLVKQGWNIVVERGAGESAGFPDHEYVEAGATLVSAADELWDQAQIVVAVRIAGADPMHFPQVHSRLKSRHLVIGMCNPLEHVEEMQQLAATQANCFALELLPPHLTCASHGCAVFAGESRWVQGNHHGCLTLSSNLSHVDDRGRHLDSRPCLCVRSWCRRIASHSHGATARSHRESLRCPTSSEG